jgi:hypothetical protein
MAYTYLRRSFDYSGGLFRAALESTEAAFVTWHGLLAAATCLACLGIFMLLLRPSIASMDRDIKHARGMFLLFPPDVLAGVAQFLTATGELDGERGEEEEWSIECPVEPVPA